MTTSNAGVAERHVPCPIVTASDRVRMKEIGAQMTWGAQQCRRPRTLGEALGRMDEIARRLGVCRGAKDDGGVSAILAHLPVHKAALARLDLEGKPGGDG